MHGQLTIAKAGVPLVAHHFFIAEMEEIAEYARRAIARFCQDNPDVSLLDLDVTLKFSEGVMPVPKASEGSML